MHRPSQRLPAGAASTWSQLPITSSPWSAAKAGNRRRTTEVWRVTESPGAGWLAACPASFNPIVLGSMLTGARCSRFP